MQKAKNKKVVVALSGGVDSSVVALMLKNEGYSVIGLHMKDGDSDKAIEDETIVKELCKRLDIQCHIIEFKSEMQFVKDYFINEYKNGRTPNPCVICNREVKFKPFLDFAKEFGADYFATGHYAIVEHNGYNHYLKKAVDKNKDQSYFLNQVTSNQLEKAIFPLGELTKDQVREIAESNNLITAHKKDSFDVCFIGSKKFKEFMKENYPEKAGAIVDINSGKKVGVHDGISKYTIGQRKGLGIGGKADGNGDGWFVVDKDIKKNILLVSQGEGDELYSTALIADGVNWIVDMSEKREFECLAKFRYRQEDQPVTIQILQNNKIKVIFKNKQRAITCGQYVVLYNENGYCLGGAAIVEIIK